jgi:hypothetical protein
MDPQYNNNKNKLKKKKKQDPISKNKLGIVAYICNPSHMGGICRRIMV